MYQLDESFIRKVFNDFSRSLVGKICKQNETIQKDQSLSKDQSLLMLKEFNKELVYESVRDLENQIKSYKQGQVSVTFNKPNPSL